MRSLFTAALLVFAGGEALLTASCASAPQAGSPASYDVKAEGSGREAVWVFTVRNTSQKTIKIAALEFRAAGAEFASIGGMAEIAHSCRQGTTTVARGESIEIIHPNTGECQMRLTYLLDGSDRRWTDVVDAKAR